MPYLLLQRLTVDASEPSTTFAHQLWVDTSSNVLKIRNAANSAFITTGLSITADNVFTGNITGNAPTATILATARTINGVSFNGSANISFGTDSVAEGSSSNLIFYKLLRQERLFQQLVIFLTIVLQVLLALQVLLQVLLV